MILIKVLFLNFDNRLGKFMKNPFDTPEREEFRAQLKAFVDKKSNPMSTIGMKKERYLGIFIRKLER